MKAEHNPTRYRELSQPHASPAVLDESLQAFFDEVSAARERHKLANVFLIVKTPVMDSTQKEVEMGSTLRLGDSFRMIELVAWAFGKEQADQREMVASAVAHGKGTARE